MSSTGFIDRMDQLKERLTACGITKPVPLSLTLGFISGVLLSLSALLVKYLINIHPGQLAVYMLWEVASFSLIHLVYRQDHVLGPPGYRTLVLVRSILGAIGNFFLYIAFRYLPLGEAAAIISSHPAFVTVGAKFILKESFHLLELISIFLSITGMVLITRVHESLTGNSRIYTREDIYGFAAGTITVLTLTSVVILTKKMKHIHFSVLVFGHGFFGVIVCGVGTSFVGNFSLHYRGQEIIIITLGFLTYFGLTFLAIGIQYGNAGPVSTMRVSSDILFSFVLQVIVFNDVPSGITIVGASLIGTSVVLVGFSKPIKGFFTNRVRRHYFSHAR